MIPIDSIDMDIDFRLYRATLYRGGRIDVHVIKQRPNRQGGTAIEGEAGYYLSAIKPGSANYKKAIKELRARAVHGSLLREQLDECGFVMPAATTAKRGSPMARLNASETPGRRTKLL